jgi:two-component system, NtrC family, sensor histidine kinase HydH
MIGKPDYTRLLILTVAVTGISMFHYFTPLHASYLHDIFQRLYYIPIILSALWFGLRGGLFCSVIVSIVYAPHILYQWGGDFSMETGKYLEILLFNIVGGLTGFLSQLEKERTAELKKTAEGLEISYSKLKAQSERIMAIEEQLRRAEKLSTMVELAAVLAHEVRNPLGSIRGTAEILRDDYPPDNPKHEFIDIQIRETERLNRVVSEFLQMVRPRPSDMQPCNVMEELETIATLLTNDARNHHVEIVLEPSGKQVPIMADSEKLRQAFLNIILNALQAAPAGSSVSIAVDASDSVSLSIRIHDSGPGIDPGNLDRLFVPFFTTKPDGTGLGLSITKKIIESHNGTIAIESLKGKGTTVIIRLPVSEKAKTVTA